METALEQARDRTRQAGASRIHRIRLRVGALSGVVPEALEFAFAALSMGGPAEGATLEIESVRAMRWCDGCQAEFEAAAGSPECPLCGAWSHDLRSGLELELASLEVS